MATYLKKHNNKPTFSLTKTERWLFLAITMLLAVGVVWKINDSAIQRKAIKPITQHQFLFNQACQQALNQGEDRNVSYCLSAQHYNHVMMLALKDNHIDLSEMVELESYFQRQYQPFTH
ncbi:hypothetical protein ACGRL8_16900 [Vibrio rumoiensis]|uniref:Uncharacterized protein n=1 Tax=Vibrio rumoiensis TaxID=76258 RepID=A0ABW7IXG4_9VIBR